MCLATSLIARPAMNVLLLRRPLVHSRAGWAEARDPTRES